MKNIIVVTLLLFFVSGCPEVKKNQTAEGKQSKQTQKILSEANNKLGLPNIHNFQQKKVMKLIYEQCDKENLICYAYLYSEYSGELKFLGKCIGYGVPFSAQYTNPSRVEDTELTGTATNKFEDSGEIQVMPQADPNGLYMPTSSSATWLMMVGPDEKPHPVYIEPEILVFPFPVHEE